MSERADGNVAPKNKTNNDAVDAWGKSRLTPATPSAVSPVERNAVYYNMRHKRRGFAYIFNHETFDSKSLKARNGTAVDSYNLSQCLKNLGFEVKIFDDLKFNDLSSYIEEVANMDHSDNDCFLIAILTHGEMGILYAQDIPYKPERIWTRFTAEKCPSLAGKPKIFIIQACQGDKLDAGINLRTQVDADVLSYKIPTHADFLIAYSTVPGFYSWRNTTNGSWFIQSLCAELLEHGTEFDVLTLFTFVCRRVALDFESNVPNNVIMDCQKQIPCITSMLTRLLKFPEK